MLMKTYSYLKIMLTYKIGKMYLLLIIQKFLYIVILINIAIIRDTLSYIIALLLSHCLKKDTIDSGNTKWIFYGSKSNNIVYGEDSL